MTIRYCLPGQVELYIQWFGRKVYRIAGSIGGQTKRKRILAEFKFGGGTSQRIMSL